jgi:hypothetical protein
VQLFVESLGLKRDWELGPFSWSWDSKWYHFSTLSLSTSTGHERLKWGPKEWTDCLQNELRTYQEWTECRNRSDSRLQEWNDFCNGSASSQMDSTPFVLGRPTRMKWGPTRKWVQSDGQHSFCTECRQEWTEGLQSSHSSHSGSPQRPRSRTPSKKAEITWPFQKR